MERWKNKERTDGFPDTRTASVVRPALTVLLATLLAASAAAQNTFPVTQSFESRTRGEPLVGQDGWQSADPTGLVVTATTGTFAADPVFTNASHTNSADFSAAVEMPLTDTGGRTRSYVEFMCKPVLGDEPKTISTANIPEWALYFNTSGKVVIRHTGHNWSTNTYEVIWTALDHAPLDANSYTRIGITIDYLTANLSNVVFSKFYRISLDGVFLTHPLGYKKPQFFLPPSSGSSGSPPTEADRNGAWFYTADFDDLVNSGFPAGKLDGFGMQGIGSVDDVFIHDSTNVPQYDLVLDSTYAGASGSPTVPGTHSYAYGSVAPCSITNSPVNPTVGTQIVCTGWTNGYGSIPASGTDTQLTAVVEQASGLTWNWETRYRLEVAASGGGSVTPTGAWVAADSIVNIDALPDTGRNFTGWSGDVPAGQTNQNPLDLTMDRARSIVAHFADSQGQYTSRGTPYAWLEEFGVMEDQETADVEDWDTDGAQTWEEFQAGTDPTNPVSRFAVLTQRTDGNSVIVDWYGTTNSGVTRGFGMYRSTNMTSWDLVVTGGLERSASGTNTWTDEAPPPRAFYRPMIPEGP